MPHKMADITKAPPVPPLYPEKEQACPALMSPQPRDDDCYAGGCLGVGSTGGGTPSLLLILGTCEAGLLPMLAERSGHLHREADQPPTPFPLPLLKVQLTTTPVAPEGLHCHSGPRARDLDEKAQACADRGPGSLVPHLFSSSISLGLQLSENSPL